MDRVIYVLMGSATWRDLVCFSLFFLCVHFLCPNKWSSSFGHLVWTVPWLALVLFQASAAQTCCHCCEIYKRIHMFSLYRPYAVSPKPQFSTMMIQGVEIFSRIPCEVYMVGDRVKPSSSYHPSFLTMDTRTFSGILILEHSRAYLGGSTKEFGMYVNP